MANSNDNFAGLGTGSLAGRAATGGTWNVLAGSLQGDGRTTEGVYGATGGGNNLAVVGTPASADYDVTVPVVQITGDGDSRGISPVGRVADSGHFYQADWNSATGSLELFIFDPAVPNSYTLFGTYAATQPARVTLRMRGPTISAYDAAGIPRITATDANISAAGQGGLKMYTAVTASTGQHATGITITDALVAGVATGGATTASTASATATDAAGGYGGNSYQWQRSTTSGSGFANVAGQTTLNLADSALTASTTYYYRLAYTDSAATGQLAETVYSAQISLTTQAALSGNATGYTLADSAGSVAVGSPETIVATLTGGTALSSPLVVTLADSLASAISGTITIAPGQTTGTATVTPTVAGNHAITATHAGGGFAGGDGSIGFVATAGAVAIPFTDANVHLFGFHGSSASATCSDPGGNVLAGFTGTSISVAWSTLPSGASVSYQIDGGAWVDTTASTGFAVSGLAAGNHSLWLMLDRLAQTGLDEWTASPPPNSITLTSITLDPGAASCSPALTPRPLRPNGTWLIYGDSITRGVQANAGTDSARRGYAFFLAQSMGVESIPVGKGYQGYTTPGGSGSNNPTFALSYPFYSAGVPRSFAGLAGILVAHGTNDFLNNTSASDATIAAAITPVLVGLRAKAVSDGVPSIPIKALVPCGGNSATGFVQFRKAAVAAGVAAAPAGTATLADPGPELVKGLAGSVLTGDGLHPRYELMGTPQMASLCRSAVGPGPGAGGLSIYAAASDVRDRVDRGDGTPGTLVVPIAPTVQLGVVFDNGTVGSFDPVTSRYTDAGAANVALGHTYLFAGVTETGTFAGSSGGGGLDQADADLVVSTLLGEVGAIEAGRTFRQSLRKITASTAGYLDFSVAGFVRYMQEDGTEAFRIPAAGRTSITFGPGL